MRSEGEEDRKIPKKLRCPHCADLNIAYAIRTPGELKKAIRVVLANVQDGTLKAVSANGEVVGFEIPEGPWPDIIEIDFRCRHCDASFRLIAETYHGSGGEWSPAGGPSGST